LVLFLCFNAFPDYNDVDSWEGTLRSIDRMCLCGGGLAASANVSGRCAGRRQASPTASRAALRWFSASVPHSSPSFRPRLQRHECFAGNCSVAEPALWGH
jgi:hypothetical protein